MEHWVKPAKLLAGKDSFLLDQTLLSERVGDVHATTVIPGELSEGEKEKIIQISENNFMCNVSKNQPKIHSEASANSEAQNSVLFPSAPEIYYGVCLPFPNMDFLCYRNKVIKLMILL
jgi:hypothetical protein